jgi:hypothetical protein
MSAAVSQPVERPSHWFDRAACGAFAAYLLVIVVPGAFLIGLLAIMAESGGKEPNWPAGVHLALTMLTSMYVAVSLIRATRSPIRAALVAANRRRFGGGVVLALSTPVALVVIMETVPFGRNEGYWVLDLTATAMLVALALVWTAACVPARELAPCAECATDRARSLRLAARTYARWGLLLVGVTVLAFTGVAISVDLIGPVGEAVFFALLPTGMLAAVASFMMFAKAGEKWWIGARAMPGERGRESFGVAFRGEAPCARHIVDR